MSWSAEQQRLLGAMGYTLYQRAAPGPATMPMAADLAPAKSAARSGPASARIAASGGIDRLLAALQRTVPGSDVLALVGDIDVLRRDPMKKRALWPQLRALRRAH